MKTTHNPRTCAKCGEVNHHVAPDCVQCHANLEAPRSLSGLVGEECGCLFDMPHHDWPVPGSPAWVIVLAVDMPMIEMRGGGKPFWINASKIERIWKA